MGIPTSNMDPKTEVSHGPRIGLRHRRGEKGLRGSPVIRSLNSAVRRSLSAAMFTKLRPLG